MSSRGGFVAHDIGVSRASGFRKAGSAALLDLDAELFGPLAGAVEEGAEAQDARTPAPGTPPPTDQASEPLASQIQQLADDLRLAQLSLTLSEQERSKLQRLLEEAASAQQGTAQRLAEVEAQYRSDSNAQRAQIEALETRAAAAEQRLDEAHRALASRAEERRASEQLMADATLLRNVVESRLGQIEAGHAERDARIRSLETERTGLVQRNEALGRTAATHASAYRRAQEQIGSLQERIRSLEAELAARSKGATTEIESLAARLLRENSERSTAEGTAEAGRREVTRLMRELATLQQRTTPAAPSSSVTSVTRLPPAPRLQSVA
jgi:chemotaxis protein MotB